MEILNRIKNITTKIVIGSTVFFPSPCVFVILLLLQLILLLLLLFIFFTSMLLQLLGATLLKMN